MKGFARGRVFKPEAQGSSEKWPPFYKRYIESLRYITRLGQICASIQVYVNSQKTCLRL